MSKKLLSIEANGTPVVTKQGIIELAYQDKLASFFEWEDTEAKQRFVSQCQQLDSWPFEPGSPDVESRDWFTPPEYQNIDLETFFQSRCSSEQQRTRARVELELVKRMNAESIFRHLIYLVDQWRSCDLVWGVGRGSSVSCFLLFLIGINKINPLDYDLDHREFFKV